MSFKQKINRNKNAALKASVVSSPSLPTRTLHLTSDKRNKPRVEGWGIQTAIGNGLCLASACPAGASLNTYFCSPDDHISQAEPGPFNWLFRRLPTWLRAPGNTGWRPGDTNCFSARVEGLRCPCPASAGAPPLLGAGVTGISVPSEGARYGVLISLKSLEWLMMP